MHEFRVWAPNARHVTLRVDGKDVPMERALRGNWRAKVESAGHGSDYGFLLDDDAKVYPDPRSLWQPNGVHGLSRVYDASRFPWTDRNWHPRPLKDAVIYELHAGTFTGEGTFDSLIAKLPYLRELGVTHVELMPVSEFDGERGWGYDGVELYATHRAYGGPEALQHLVNACHEHGLAVLLDVVYNHFGPVGNYAPRFGPFLTDKHVTPWSGAINLEESGSYEVRNYLVDNALQWLRDFHFDGLRLDAVHSMVDRSAYHFLEELADRVHACSEQTGRDFVLIAESDLNDPRIITPKEQGGMGLDAQWIDDFHHALWTVLTGERHAYFADFGRMAELAKALQCGYVYDGVYSEFRHRRHGRPVQGLSSDRFVVCIHNHDQVANRAKSERLHQVAGMAKAKIGAAVVLLSPFVPMLFQGEEFATSTPFHYFVGFTDEELCRTVREGRKAEHAGDDVPWEDIDPTASETFAESKIRWQEIEGPKHQEMLRWYKDLIALRCRRAELRDTNLQHVDVRFDEKEKWLVMRRGGTTLACNISSERREVPLQGKWQVLLESQPGFQMAGDAASVPAETAVVLSAN